MKTITLLILIKLTVCSYSQEVEIMTTEHIAFYFPVGKSKLSDIQTNTIDSIAQIENIETLVIEGYASPIGNIEANLVLSKQRAHIVRDSIEKLNHKIWITLTKGNGEDDSELTNHEKQRVDIWINSSGLTVTSDNKCSCHFHKKGSSTGLSKKEILDLVLTKDTFDLKLDFGNNRQRCFGTKYDVQIRKTLIDSNLTGSTQLKYLSEILDSIPEINIKIIGYRGNGTDYHNGNGAFTVKAGFGKERTNTIFEYLIWAGISPNRIKHIILNNTEAIYKKYLIQFDPPYWQPPFFFIVERDAVLTD